MNQMNVTPQEVLDLHAHGTRHGFVAGVIFSAVAVATYRKIVKRQAPPQGPFVVN